MARRRAAIFVLCLLAAAVCRAEDSWTEVSPNVLRSPGLPCSYALVDGNSALLIGAARGVNVDELKTNVERVLVTHHHRDSVARLEDLIKAGAKASAPAASAE